MKNILKKSIEYGFYLFVFILPWQTRWIIKEGSINNSYSEYASFSLYGSDILLFALFALSLLYYLRAGEKKYEKKFLLPVYAIAALDLVAFVSIFFAPDHILAVYKYINLLMSIGVFFLISLFPLKKKILLFSLSLSLFIQAILAGYQFLSQNSPVNKWFGMAPHIPYEAGVSVVEAMGSLGFVERWLRAYGALPHPNILGGFLVLGLAIITIYYISQRKVTHYLDDDEINVRVFKENVFFNLVFLTTLVGIFFSFSRSAWLSAMLFFVVFLFVAILKRDKLAQKYLLPKILFAGIVLFIVTQPFMNLIEVRAESRGRIERISQTERASSSSMAIEIIKDKWAIGTGIGNYTVAVSRDYKTGEQGYFYQPAHNVFLLIFSEIGILGLVAFIFLLISIFFINSSADTMIFRLSLFLLLIVLLYYDHWLWSLHFGMLYFWLIMGLVFRFFALDSKASDVL